MSCCVMSNLQCATHRSTVTPVAEPEYCKRGGKGGGGGGGGLLNPGREPGEFRMGFSMQTWPVWCRELAALLRTQADIGLQRPGKEGADASSLDLTLVAEPIEVHPVQYAVLQRCASGICHTG